MTATIIERWKLCGIPLPLNTDWEDPDIRGCRLDLGHDGAHLIEVQRLGPDMCDRFTYRARFGGKQ